MYPPIHRKPVFPDSFERLDMLWEKYPKYHDMTVFSSMDELLEEHPSWKEGYEEIREEYEKNEYDRFLIQLSLNDLSYRFETKKLITKYGTFRQNPYVKRFMDQFSHLDTDHDACFIFPESFVSQFFVIMEVCKRAKEFHPVRNLFSDEEKVHYLAVFDKQNMDDVLLMFHLLYTNTTEDLYGGYSLYDYSLVWYQTHLNEENIVLRSPYLPDPVAAFQGGLPYCFNPLKTVQVRQNIAHILQSGYFLNELEFFLCLTKEIMPVFQWWYKDLFLYEEKDGYHTDWRLERTKIRTQLTADGVIHPKWKHELTLFNAVRKRYPDTLYQYRPGWLGLQSLDIYIPSIKTAIEYQGIQHYRPVDFFGGEEALGLRNELDLKKKKLCIENDVRLIEWSYALDPTDANIRKALEDQKEDLFAEFLKLKDFDEYLEHYERFTRLKTGKDTFEKEQELMGSDTLYTRRQKEVLLEKKKKEILKRLHEEIASLVNEIEEKGVWLPVRGRKRIEIRYAYPDGKKGDIRHYLAGQYDEPKKISEKEYVIKADRKNREMIEMMCFSGRSLFTLYRSDPDDPALEFLLEYNRIAMIEKRMDQINSIKEEFRTLRAIEDPALKKLLKEHHKKLNDRANEIYEYLIAEGLTNPRWRSEQTAYAIVRSHYEDAKFQYQPDFLYGQRIDIFIPSANTAIEYQGAQHYNPVDFFGGEEGQKQNMIRDMRKQKRCKAHGIQILYWDYDKPLSDEYFINEIMPKIIKNEDN